MTVCPGILRTTTRARSCAPYTSEEASEPRASSRPTSAAPIDRLNGALYVKIEIAKATEFDPALAPCQRATSRSPVRRRDARLEPQYVLPINVLVGFG